jgi:hypothetical protein
LEDCEVFGSSLALEFFNEAALPNPRLAGKYPARASALVGTFQGLLQRIKLVSATNKD